MKNAITISAVALLVATIVGLAALGIYKSRQAAALVGCTNNLKQFGLALHAYNDTHNHFPIGTLANPDLPPEKRFSWLAAIYPAHMESGPVMLFDTTKTWDAPVNCPPRWILVDATDLSVILDDHVMSEFNLFLCPANPARSKPHLPGLTHYMGVAGLGEAAANYRSMTPKRDCLATTGRSRSKI